ncbi:hypothetical protein GCM10022393_25780 [Aquimarina addita]|uniref:Lipid/polyisoprenoid-binding YceI-like domain-containing protein n=2 Tax=Aquimarina addita TaxID=870485 RepID=A0ABP6UL46_9FLAO
MSYSQFTNGNLTENPRLSDGYTGHEEALINDFIKLEFDTENSKISFNFISEDTEGTIGGLDYKISFSPDNPDNAYFRGSALVKTLDTDNFLRDGHLMWEKFFYKSKYPKIEFASSQVVHFGNNNYKVIGDLTIKGVTKEVIINFMLDTQKLLGKTTIYTSDFGVNIHDKRDQNKLNIVFDFPLLR